MPSSVRGKTTRNPRSTTNPTNFQRLELHDAQDTWIPRNWAPQSTKSWEFEHLERYQREPFFPLQHSKAPRNPNLSKICPAIVLGGSSQGLEFVKLCRNLKNGNFRTNVDKFLTNSSPRNAQKQSLGQILLLPLTKTLLLPMVVVKMTTYRCQYFWHRCPFYIFSISPVYSIFWSQCACNRGNVQHFTGCWGIGTTKKGPNGEASGILFFEYKCNPGGPKRGQKVRGFTIRHENITYPKRIFSNYFPITVSRFRFFRINFRKLPDTYCICVSCVTLPGWDPCPCRILFSYRYPIWIFPN